MNLANILRFGILGAIWLWLAATILIRSGITLINLFWVVASGILVFVPLYRKYVQTPAATPNQKGSGKSGVSRKKR